MAQFPHWDLFDFAEHLKHLGSEGGVVVLRLFEAAFATEPKPGEWEEMGGAILPLRMQNRDNWNSVRYSLSLYYESCSDADAALMTDIACIARNAAMRCREKDHESCGNVLATLRFRGVDCGLIEDFGHIWDRDLEHEESRILSRFEALLDEWSAAGDVECLGLALDHFAVQNRTSLMWKVFMEAGSKHPATLGRELEPVLAESLFFTHPDYSYGGTLLFAALHKAGDEAQRGRLENLILDLPRTARFFDDEPRDPMPDWLKYAQNKMLGALEENLIVLPRVRALRVQRAERTALPANREPECICVTSWALSDEEQAEYHGVNLKDPVNAKLFRLCETLKPLLGRDGGKVAADVIDRHWLAIGQCERAVWRNHLKHRKMAEELWGHLVGACESIVRYAEWPSGDSRWRAVRRILLKASTDPSPKASGDDDAKEDRWPAWGWPAPRLDAARGLLYLIFRFGRADADTMKAVLRLCRDESHPLRFNMGDRLAALERVEPELMWQLIDRFIRYERKFSVLETVVMSLDRLWGGFANEVKQRLSRIDTRAIKDAPAEHSIHKRLTGTHLFRYLRTGDEESESYIAALIADCDSKRASVALASQLHDCRKGGWLTAGDAVKVVNHEEAVRRRTWDFYEKLLNSSQTKLKQHRERWQQLHSAGQPVDEDVRPVEDAIKNAFLLVDRIAMQVYFASGALADRQNGGVDRLAEPQKFRFWIESADVFRALATEIHPHTTHHVVRALHHLLPCAPQDVFLIAANAIISSSSAGYQNESLAVGTVVKLIQCVLADHRDIFKATGGNESECLVALLRVLDLFVEAGWTEARQLTHRLEEIYR